MLIEYYGGALLDLRNYTKNTIFVLLFIYNIKGYELVFVGVEFLGFVLLHTKSEQKVIGN